MSGVHGAQLCGAVRGGLEWLRRLAYLLLQRRPVRSYRPAAMDKQGGKKKKKQTAKARKEAEQMRMLEDAAASMNMSLEVRHLGLSIRPFRTVYLNSEASHAAETLLRPVQSCPVVEEQGGQAGGPTMCPAIPMLCNRCLFGLPQAYMAMREARQRRISDTSSAAGPTSGGPSRRHTESGGVLGAVDEGEGEGEGQATGRSRRSGKSTGRSGGKKGKARRARDEEVEVELTPEVGGGWCDAGSAQRLRRGL